MGNIVLALQGGVANGSEPTFDGQPMQKGVHLRWSFLAALGFPPGGFWLCRRAAVKGEKRIPPPPSAAEQAATQSSTAAPQAIASNAVASTTAGGAWEAVMRQPCQSVMLAGCAAPGCDEVVIETFCRNANGELTVSDRRAVRVEQGAFRISVQAASIACVRVVGAGSVDECGCGTMQPPTDCGCGTGGVTGGGGNGPGSGQPVWGTTNDNGWQCWGVPFTLPVTNAHWPARYFGAPNPATTAPTAVALADLHEARRRLGTLKLEASLTPAKQEAALAQLRAELMRLVDGFQNTLLNEVQLPPSNAGANAPNLNINVMQELLLLALDPYFARVLGLYFVDDQVAAGATYDYCITGYWGATPCDNTVIFPGLTPGAPLARGSATFGGLTIAPLGTDTTFWRWTKFDINGNYDEQIDPTAPAYVQSIANGIAAGMTEAQQPDALLLAASPGAWWIPATPMPQFSISLTQPMPRVDVQVWGNGMVQGLSNGTVISSASFNSTLLQTVTVNTPNITQMIDQIQVIGAIFASWTGYVIAIGAITLHPLSPDVIGTRYAIMPPPIGIQPVAAPGQPTTIFRHRQANIDTNTLTLVPSSLFDVVWPALPPSSTPPPGDPVTDPLQLPPPTSPIGFVAQRQDSGVAGSATNISGWVATRTAPAPVKNSGVTTTDLYRLVDSQRPDPVQGWSHRVAGFDLFGALGTWSAWSAPRQVEKIAAAPTAMRIRQFDNSAANGGAPSPDGSAWIGGTLNLIVNWAGAAFMMYPDIVTARISVQGLDPSGNVTGTLATHDLVVLPPTIQQLTVTSMAPTPAITPDRLSYTVEVQTNPPLTVLSSTAPGQVLVLTLPDGSSDRYAVRPAVSVSAPQNATSPVVAALTASRSARIIASNSDYIGQPAYLVSGYGTNPIFQVPLDVPISQQTARAQATVTGSTQNPFLVNEQIVDPNGFNLDKNEPQSVPMIFSGPQRLLPAAPPTPPTPVHKVNHRYYNPANANGDASQTLPFTTPSVTGVSGYVLQREPVRSLTLVDVKRRNGLNPPNPADPNPVVLDSGVPRADLAAWIAAVSKWLSDYNALQAYNAAHASPTSYTPLTATTVLTDTGGQRAFVEHFYGGLLDDELCALADSTLNSPGYVRVNSQPISPDTTIIDTVNGNGYGRTVYRLAAVNQAGSFSSTTNSIGPWYTTIVTPPRPPVLYKLQPTESALIVAWALDTNPDVAAYAVYRGTSMADLADLRYFGADPAHPSPPSDLPSVQYNTQNYPLLSFVQGSGANIDARIVGFVPDPRLCARDYNGSDMGEVVLPTGPPPDVVNGIYRLSDYLQALGPTGQLGFNYWTPPAVGGIAQLVNSSATQSRLTGLRIGLGRGVPVVVVATWGTTMKALGVVPIRRAAFIDSAPASDPNAIPGVTAPSTTAPNAYAVVSVDIFGNRSASSAVFAAQMLMPVTA